MKRMGLSMLMVGWLLVLAACAGQEDISATFDEAALQSQAEAVADAMRAGDFAAVTAEFDATMSAQLSEAALREGWDATVASLGAYEGRSSVAGAEQEGYYVVKVTERYASSGLLVRVVYDPAGQIAGLQINYADISAPVSGDAFQEVEVTVAADPELPLGGTLTLPQGVTWPPVVILVQGSGSSSRNEAINGNKPFQDIAHGLAEYGIATLRYDKRYYVYPEQAAHLGAELTLRDEVLDDVYAAIALLQADERVDGARVYVLGHSLGGMLVPAIAAERPELAGVIAMAGTLRPLWEVVYDQNQEAIAALDKSALSAEDQATLAAQTAQIEADLATLRGDFTALPNDTLLLGVAAGYWKSLRELNGMDYIQQVTMPMLILQGEADFQVSPERDYALWQETLGPRDNVTFHLYPGLNHLMMPTQGRRDISEYQETGTVDPQVIQDIAEFVGQGKGD